ncbi:hypothetical protein [Flavobacterium granuli]|uniref:Uncharacterized protein n=1 Tax=Flavobacterium granuli TaxID=280093 RepID=A0A1M5TCC3_9FLAO|nr:hypothetical protein [Flavobacterium granuli]PRZ20312.1 hypothetical protein BC624_1121 [Flavobacterium granuli]SHH48336.1 hypothetical protein SAMN05443373_1141 [Flavobacterium granuli]
MTTKFDTDKIVAYLERHKSDLPTLYNWNAKIERLVELGVLSDKQVNEINSLSNYEKELQLKKVVGQKLNITLKTNKDLFDKLCLWVIKDWGGILTANDNDTIKLIEEFLKQDKPAFNRIASSSKVGAYLFPEKNIIYDSRVAYSLNWIILSENAGQQYFPIPEGRNSKMSAFDLNVLIRLKNISNYQPKHIEHLDHKLYINNADKKLFINKKDAYFELNNLIKIINKKLWSGDNEKEQNLYYTEMLLFSIADREIFMDITSKFGIN